MVVENPGDFGINLSKILRVKHLNNLVVRFLSEVTTFCEKTH